MLTPQQFQAKFTAFADTSTDDIQAWLDASDPYFNIPRWGDLYDDGLGYWVAHMLTVENSLSASIAAGMTDDKSQAKVGQVMKMRDSNLINKILDEPYYETRYGRYFLDLRKLVGSGGMAV